MHYSTKKIKKIIFVSAGYIRDNSFIGRKAYKKEGNWEYFNEMENGFNVRWLVPKWADTKCMSPASKSQGNKTANTTLLCHHHSKEKAKPLLKLYYLISNFQIFSNILT